MVQDILTGVGKLIPRSGDYIHRGGNSDAHIKAPLCGASGNIFIEKNELLLGDWQSLYFCEFDGPRGKNQSLPNEEERYPQSLANQLIIYLPHF